jgi:hypothetical protein
MERRVTMNGEKGPLNEEKGTMTEDKSVGELNHLII